MLNERLKSPKSSHFQPFNIPSRSKKKPPPVLHTGSGLVKPPGTGPMIAPTKIILPPVPWEVYTFLKVKVIK